MKSEKLYEEICHILLEGNDIRLVGKNFGQICSEMGVRRVKLDNLLYEKMGMSGDEILNKLRGGDIRC